MTGKAEIRGYLIEHTAKRLKRAFQQTLSSLNAAITVDQWVVLDVVIQQPGLSQQDICDRTAKDRPTVTRILDRLEDKQLVSRETDPEDRRRFGIYATKAGLQKVRDLLPLVRTFRNAHFDGLSDEDINHLLRIMKKINENIKNH